MRELTEEEQVLFIKGVLLGTQINTIGRPLSGNTVEYYPLQLAEYFKEVKTTATDLYVDGMQVYNMHGPIPIMSDDYLSSELWAGYFMIGKRLLHTGPQTVAMVANLTGEIYDGLVSFLEDNEIEYVEENNSIYVVNHWAGELFAILYLQEKQYPLGNFGQKIVNFYEVLLSLYAPENIRNGNTVDGELVQVVEEENVDPSDGKLIVKE